MLMTKYINQNFVWVYIGIALLFLSACKERNFMHPLDPDGLGYIGDANSVDSDSNNVADVLDPQMTLVLGGCFHMGTVDGEVDEVFHKVCIDSLYIGRYEVTVKEYKAVNNQTLVSLPDEFPITEVSWYEAVNYCNGLSKLRGFKQSYRIASGVVEFDATANGYRLLTEAEWEYAYAADSGKQYYWADSLSPDAYTWHLGNSGASIHRPGEKLSNAFGLYDMSGNVSEWVNDWYTEEVGGKNNPTGPLTGLKKVFRGGDYRMDLEAQHKTNRASLAPDRQNKALGFRIARRLR